MDYSLSWLLDVLTGAGLKVAEQPGWRSRGRSEMGKVVGVICHHTAGRRDGNMPSLGTITNGRSDLAGPLAQLGLGRDGTWYLIAAGRANHAGAGVWRGVTTGNRSFIGIEAENTGLANDTPWPEIQMDAYRHGVAAILTHVGTTSDMCCGHKEYAVPKGRKDDPDFDMDDFRVKVTAIMAGTAPPLPLIPAADAQNRPTLRRGAMGPQVQAVQKAIGVQPDGLFGPNTEATLRNFQRAHGETPDGIVGPKTWAALDAAALPAPAPTKTTI